MKDYSYEKIKVGQSESFSKKITAEMEDAFRMITGDDNPLHKDDLFAQTAYGDKFKSHVTFGMLTASLLSTLAGMYLPGKYSLIHSIDSLNFKNPVFSGDILNVTGTVRDKQDGVRLIILSVKITNQNCKVVATANMKIMVLK